MSHPSRPMIIRLAVLSLVLVLAPLFISNAVLVNLGSRALQKSGRELGDVAKKHVFGASEDTLNKAGKSFGELTREMVTIGKDTLHSAGEQQARSSQSIMRDTSGEIVTQGKESIRRLTAKQTIEFRKTLTATSARQQKENNDALVRANDRTVREGTRFYKESTAILIPMSEQAVSEEVGNVLRERARGLAEQAALGIGRAQQTLQFVSSQPGVAGLDPEAARQAMQSIISNKDGFRQLVLLNGYAEEVTRVPRAEDSKPVDWAETLEFRYPSVGDSYVSEPIMIDGKPHATMSIPVPGGGDRGGVLIGTLSLQPIVDAMRRSTAERPGYAYVTGRNDNAVLMTMENSSGPTLTEDEKVLVRRMRAGLPGGLVHSGVGDDEKVAMGAVVNYPGINMFRWNIVVVEPEKQALAGAHRLRDTLDTQAKEQERNLLQQSHNFTQSAGQAIALQAAELVRGAIVRAKDYSNRVTQDAIGEVSNQYRETSGKGLQRMSDITHAELRLAGRSISDESEKATGRALTNLKKEAERVAPEASKLMSAALMRSEDDKRTEMKKSSAVMFVLFLALAISLAFLTARSVVRPIGDLVRGTRAVAAGNYDHRVETRASDTELVELAQSFNEMAAAVKRSRMELEQANQALRESQEKLLAELAEAAGYVRSLLPPLPAPISGTIKTDWRFIPSTQLGGDSFGYHWIDEDHFGMYLIDVCGHGVGAALLSISVMNVLRSQTLPQVDFRDPAQVLGALNDAFPMQDQNNMFFTIWYGVYSPTNRTIEYSTGGHPPAVLVSKTMRGESVVSQLRTANMVIGGLPGIPFDSDHCELEGPGKLFIFSDGAYEITRPDGTDMRLDEFVDQITKSSKSPERDLDNIVDYIRRERGSDSLDDDLSIVEVEFRQDESFD